ncbi:MAG: hypothetical protein MUF51_03055 [Vicinamibacteria bacterium]|jgi:hypothetical protein|nr:hypothetical protein [Vicinamibacteria bacterium]
MECAEYREQMLDLLYGEDEPGQAIEIREHLRHCLVCRREYDALRGVRQKLTTWKVPPALSLRPAPSIWRGLRGLAAAACIIFAIGGALGFSGAELRYENNVFSLSFGRDHGAAQRLIAEHEQRERAAATGAVVQPAAVTAPQSFDEALLLRRVDRMIRESEGRQAVLWNSRLMDVRQRFDTQRRYDLAKISAGLSYLEGKTGQHVARTTELINYVMQASDRQE